MVAIPPSTTIGVELPPGARWLYVPDSTVEDPGAGKIRVNNQDWTQVTRMMVSVIDENDDDYTEEIERVTLRTRIQLYDKQGVTIGSFEATDDPVLHDGWLELPVIWESGGPPKLGTYLYPAITAQHWWTLTEPGDIAEWDVTNVETAEIWAGGDYVDASVIIQVRRFGFSWTPVPINSNRSPNTVYLGEVVLPTEVTVVGTSRMLIGANRLRMILKSVTSGSVNVDIASPRTGLRDASE